MSIQLFFMDKMLRVMVRRRFRKDPDIMTLRTLMEEMGDQVRPAPAPVVVQTVELGNVSAERLAVPDADETKALLYIHGGGFVAGVPANHRPLTWRLAAQTKVPVYAVDYRLAPEHPFPAGLEDCVAAYRALLARGLTPSHIAIGGDSAGGNLALATALKLKQDGVALPACLVCLSPVTDLAEPTASHRENVKSDAMFDPRTFASVTAAYCPNRDPKDPLISPLRGEVSGLPPTLFLCSGAEMLRDDSVRMAERMKQAGVETAIDVWPKVFHVWPVMADILPEGRKAIEGIAAFIRTRLGG